ncbi:MAG: tRNA-dihydrouridine synthase family protein [Clostridia bacterium]|nr:tRNA-dihydrouridine synthase family protein [Clostridia bacterium]
MTIYFAPLEGVTDVIYRRTHASCFSGVDKYFIPFVSPTHHLVFTPKEKRAVSPAENTGFNAVPQILSKNAEQFIWAAKELHALGYQEVNLNLGCPSGTVTSKGKGSGMLRDLDTLRSFLDEIFMHTPVNISLKTRIGFSDIAEWSQIWDILSQYPASEVIIHPRTRQQFYKGSPFHDAYAHALQTSSQPLVYNGDLFTIDDCRALTERYPQTSALMLGRGLLSYPTLAQELKGGAKLTRETLRDFHDRLYNAYLQNDPKNVALIRMRVVMNHLACCFTEPGKALKTIRKAQNDNAYLQAIQQLFEEYDMCETPRYYGPDELNF